MRIGTLPNRSSNDWRRDDPANAEIYAALSRSRTVFHTPTVLGTLRDLRETLEEHILRVEDASTTIFIATKPDAVSSRATAFVEMLIFDEAERLSMTALELIRDIFDRTGVGVILIGMPGMEKRLSRYPQFYSRVGFAHHYRALTGDELIFRADPPLALAWPRPRRRRFYRRPSYRLDRPHHRRQLPPPAPAVRANRAHLKINELTVITDDVVEAARSILVVGVT